MEQTKKKPFLRWHYQVYEKKFVQDRILILLQSICYTFIEIFKNVFQNEIVKLLNKFCFFVISVLLCFNHSFIATLKI